MNWKNLSIGYCINECNEPLENRGGMIFCNYCSFKIRMSKYQEIIKGKKSKNYKAKIANITRIKRYKEKQQKAVQVNIDERRSNLKRMFAKGLISKEEYFSKLNI